MGLASLLPGPKQEFVGLSWWAFLPQSLGFRVLRVTGLSALQSLLKKKGDASSTCERERVVVCIHKDYG